MWQKIQLCIRNRCVHLCWKTKVVGDTKKSRRKPHSWRDKEPNVNIKYDLWPLMQIRRKVSRRKSIILLPTIVNIEFFFLAYTFQILFVQILERSWPTFDYFLAIWLWLFLTTFGDFWSFSWFIFCITLSVYTFGWYAFISLISIQLFRMQFWFLAQ